MLQEKTVDRLIDIDTIYLEAGVHDFKRGKEILAKYDDAKLIEVPSQ